MKSKKERKKRKKQFKHCVNAPRLPHGVIVNIYDKNYTTLGI